MKIFGRKLLLLLISLVTACTSIPDQKLYQAKLGTNYEVRNDSIIVSTPNPLHCPVKIGASSQNVFVDSLLKTQFPVILSPLSDTTFIYSVKDTADIQITFSASFGDPGKKLKPYPMSLPFPKGRTYKIIQGYNGSFSHQSTYSKFAIDFDMKTGDTVTVADDGFVVGVIEGYKDGGNSRKWRDYANFITVYHPHSGFFTQYTHLVYNGSLVDVGDTVKMGQPIGLSGNTGFSSGEHLHFNVLIPGEPSFISYPTTFKEGYNGRVLKKGMTVKK